MALTAYLSPCDGGTLQVHTSGSCPESAYILALVLFDPAFDVASFFDDSTPPADSESKANWDAAVTAGDIRYIIKEAGGQLGEPTENTTTNLRRVPELVDLTYSPIVQLNKVEGNEGFMNWVNDNKFGLGIITEDYKIALFVDKKNNFAKASAVAKPIDVEGRKRIQIQFNAIMREVFQIKDIPADLLD